jgi:hypothetical protein
MARTAHRCQVHQGKEAREGVGCQQSQPQPQPQGARLCCSQSCVMYVTYALRLFQRPLGLGWAPADGAPRCARAFALRSAARWRALCTSQTRVGAWYPGSGAGRRPKRSPDLSLPVCDAWRNDYLDRYTCTPHDAPGSRRAAILARGSVNKQPLQPMKVLEPAVASSARGGVNTKPLLPAQAPVAPTSRKKHCTACHQRLPSGGFSSCQLRSCETEPLHGGVKPVFGNRASCPRTKKPLAAKSTRSLQQNTGGV